MLKLFYSTSSAGGFFSPLAHKKTGAILSDPPRSDHSVFRKSRCHVRRCRTFSFAQFLARSPRAASFRKLIGQNMAPAMIAAKLARQ